MNWWFQLICLSFVGAFLGGQLNRGIYRLAIINPRLIGAWSMPAPGAAPRCWYDRIPVFGWVFLRRESNIHGEWFWLRPMLIELAVTIGLPAQFWWDMTGGLIPEGFPLPPQGELLTQYGSHITLFALMIVASFIDIDEKTIPDEITVVGTLMGIAWATVFPASLLPNPSLPSLIAPLWLTESWPNWLNGPWGLATGLGCFLGWVYAILPKVWWTRGGLSKAVLFLVASLVRYAFGWIFYICFGAGCLLITACWWLGGLHWQGLLTSLVGMAFGGGLVWAVRVIGYLALRKEAMGFGDVTLMAMVGSFVGWQSAGIVFFLAPLTGVFLAVAQWVLTGRRDIPYGPFLCFATWLLIEFWVSIWFGRLMPVFTDLGMFIPLIVFCCLLSMYGLLTFWRIIAESLFRLDP